MTEAFDRLAAYWYSLRYQWASQVPGRLRYWLGWKLYPRFPSAVQTWCSITTRSCVPKSSFRWAPRIVPSKDHLGENRFCFLNEPIDFGDRIDWHPPGHSLLWRFHLHYFDWAPGCEASLLKRHIQSWIDSNLPGSWPGWHPYPLSVRIVNWIRASRLHPGILTDSSRVFESLACQAAFLEANLETHLGGNHLLENARALLAAGLYFDGPCARRWKATGLELLRREIPEQILPDGGHFERSPWYHLRMTHLVNDVIELLAQNSCDVPRELADAGPRMAAFAKALRHPDGSLPQFHDSLDSEACNEPAAGDASFASSGYYIFETPEGRLIADYGAPGDCYNPAHQHAGIFSYEISSGQRRVVVDAGTPTYDPGPERDRLRSTAAHNTLRVDGVDQFQVWAGFRVGRRAWTRDLRELREQHYRLLSAAHNGYRRLGVEHRRTIVCLPGAGWLVVDDLTGNGSHRVESFVHLAPGIVPEVHDGRVCLQPLGWSLLPFGSLSAVIAPGSYSPAVGVRQPSHTAILSGVAGLPYRFGYFLGPAASRLTVSSAGSIQIEASGRALSVMLGPIGSPTIEVSYN